MSRDALRRTRESVTKAARNIKLQPVRVKIRYNQALDLAPKGLLDTDMQNVLDHTSGATVFSAVEIEEATGVKLAGLEYAIVDFDSGITRFVYKDR